MPLNSLVVLMVSEVPVLNFDQLANSGLSIVSSARASAPENNTNTIVVRLHVRTMWIPPLEDRTAEETSPTSAVYAARFQQSRSSSPFLQLFTGSSITSIRLTRLGDPL